MSERILRHVVANGIDGRYMRKDIALALGEAKPEAPGGSFKRAWSGLADDGLSEAAGKAIRLTDKGKEAANALPMDF